MRRTKEEAAITRQNILLAAEELFVREGFDGASLDRIAEAAGVKRGAVHFHFTNKVGILVALAERETGAMMDLAARIAEGASVDPLAALADLCVETARGLENDPRRSAIFRAMILADQRLEADDAGKADLAGFESRLYAAEHAILTAAEARGQLRGSWTATTATVVLHAFMCGLITSWTARTSAHVRVHDGIAALRQLVASFAG